MRVAELQQIIPQKNPLPIKTTATIETDGESPITAQIFSNGANTHRAVVPVTVPYTVTVGDHTFALTPLILQTTSDFHDYFSVSVQY